ncbi:cyclopropane-fatty-acyl-phospholipid synthase family protein [Streptosporangium sp. 'caverna']|uniref:SAM-dependent methyltransferase n=1 Tax=Streptosporangium sp. 'caverna' TaxID=2202249 RepID=UPI000D7D36C5|nr:cyclopropane-fatty-acyl-phospholipid synthase family protein [Streptosporangium sp. 'caverna']AWS42113.1 SAM-dependent methyltransferase [Streptosporangium sp. 'caverna']
MTVTAPAATGAAGVLAPLLRGLFGGEPPLRLRTWDGGSYGPADAPTVVLRSPRALRRMLWSPGELGLARAYVTGELDVEGDLADGLRRVREAVAGGPGAARPRVDRVRAVRALLRLRTVIGRPPAPPATEARLGGRPHSRGRDRAAISHHYDLSNDFYALILDGSMAYSSAFFEPGDTLAGAQRRKLDMICRKLRLEPGMRLLDVGCGWGSLVLHAAREYGVSATGVTLSGEQKAFVESRSAGLDVTVRLQDYRDVADGPYDAIGSVEMGEHVGRDNYPLYASALHRLVRPGGRVLVQQMSRGAGHPGGGPFIETYIAPDMHMRPVGATIALLEAPGLTFEHAEAMGEHYVRTVREWHRTFESRYAEAVALVGEETARVWRLYLVGGALAFEQGRMDVHQVLLRRP